MAYSLALFVHSVLRWVTVILGVVLCARSFAGMRAARPVAADDRRLSLFFLIAVDIQWLVGIVLYAFLSPVTHLFFQHPGPSMKDAILRFYGVEHITMMMIALVVVHISRRSSKRKEGAAYHRAQFMGTLIFLVLVAVAMPWPGRAAGRPVFRMP